MLSKFSHIKRNALALLTAALLSLTGLAAPALADVPVVTFTYTTDGDGNATITGIDVQSISDPTPTDLVIPATVDDNPVTAIGNSAFKDMGLTSVSLPDSLIVIGYQAFYGSAFTGVVIPNSVTTIDPGAFGSGALTSVTLGTSVTTIGAYAFRANSIASVVIPNSVTQIGNGAFSLNQLSSFAFLGNAPSAGDDVLGLYTPLTTVNVNYGTTGWGSTWSGKTVNVVGVPEAATAPSSVTVSQAGLVVTGHVTVDSSSAVGTVTATVGTADPVTVSAVDGDYPLTLTRADAGKSVVFSATATATGKTESSATSSTAYTFALAAAPTSVVVSQSNLTVSAVVTFAEGTTSGGVTAKVGDADPVTVSPVDDIYSLTLTRDDLGKTVVFSAVGSATGLPDSNPTSNSLTFSAATAPTSVIVSRDGLVLSAQVNRELGQAIGTVTVQIGDATPVAVEAVEGQYSKTLTRADFNKDITFRATVTETGKAESSVTASDAYNISIAAAPTAVTVSQNGLTVSADVQVAFGQSIGTVTVQVGSAAAQTVTAVDGAYAVTLTRDDLGKSVVFSATATQSGKEESDPTLSNEYVFSAAPAPSAITVTQTGFVLSAHITVDSSASVGTVTATVGTANSVVVAAVDGEYPLTLSRADSGKSVVFSANATATGKAVSDSIFSDAYTFAVAAAPTSVVVSQNNLNVSAVVTFADGTSSGGVTATVGSADAVVVEPVDGLYSLALTRDDLGKTVVFSAVGSATGLPDSDSVSSAPFTFSAAVAPTSVTISRDGLVLSAQVNKSLGQEIGTVTVQIGDGTPAVVEAVEGQYSTTLTRADFNKDIVFRATVTESGKAESVATASSAYNVSVAAAPTSIDVTQNGLVVSAGIGVGLGQGIGTVTVQVGSAAPEALNAVDGAYSVNLTREDLGKSVVFTATATQSGKEESDSVSSDAYTFSAATAPSAVTVTQSGLDVTADVTVAEGDTVAAVTATIGDADPVAVTAVNGHYSLTLTRDDLGKTVVFTATAAHDGKAVSDATASSPFTFSAATAPSAVTVTQNDLIVTAGITVADGNAVGVVTATIGDANPVTVVPVANVYSLELTRADAGKTVTFSATATSSGKAESASTSSEPFTFAVATAPTAIALTQTNLTVSAAITFAEGTSAGPVTIKVGDADPVAVDPVDGGYSVSLMRRDLGKAIIFSAIATQTGLPNSDAFTSDALTLAAAAAPSAVTATQNGLVVTAGVTVAEGDTVNSVTASVGSDAPIEVSLVDDAYRIELTRADAGKTVVFTANAASAGKAVSESTSSDALTFSLTAAPTGISVTQSDLTVSANVTFAEGTTAGPVTATVGDADPVTVEPTDGLYTLTLTREELGKSVTFKAVATQTGLPDSDVLTSDAFTFSAADAPSSVVATQNGLVVTAAIIISGGAIGTVTATVGDDDPTVISPVDDVYSIELTRGDIGKSVVFTATRTEPGKAESEPTSSTPLTFGLAASPTSIVVTQSALTVSAAVTFAEGTVAGPVSAVVGDADPVLVDAADGLYTITLTREDLTKTVTFSAVGSHDGLPDSEPTTSEPFTFSAAAAPSAVTVSQSGLTVSAAITVADGDSVGVVNAVVGDSDPVIVSPVDGSYSIDLTRDDAGKTVVFTATATSSGKAESDVTSSEALTFAIAAAPTAIVVSQSDLTVSAAVTWAEDTTPGSVTATVDGSSFPVVLSDDVYSVALTRNELGRTVVFSAVGSKADLPDSDVFTSEPFVFSAATAPSTVTATQTRLIVTAGIVIAEGDAIGKVTVTIGDADPVIVEPTEDAYSVELNRSDAGKVVVFSATATSTDKAESDAVYSEPLAFALAATPTAIVVTQSDLTVSAVVTFADGTTAGTVTATVGDGEPVTVEPADDLYSVVLTREDLGKEVVFSAVGTATDIPDSDPLTSEPFTFAAASAPSSITVTQSGYDLTADIAIAEGETVGTVTAQIGDADAVTVEAVDGHYTVTVDAENFDQAVVFTATAIASGKAESDATSSEPFTLASAEAPTSVTATQNGLVITAAYELGVDETVGVVTATVGDADPVTVEQVDGTYSVEVTREDIGHDVTFSVTATKPGLLASAATTSEPLTVQISQAPTAVTIQQSGLDVVGSVEVPEGVTVGSVTAVVDGADPVTVPLVGSAYTLTLTREQLGKVITFSATGATPLLPDSDAITSEELTLAMSPNPERIFITQTALTLRVAAFVRCNTDPATYGHLGTATISIDGSTPETLETVGNFASKTLTRSQLGKEVIVTGTGICSNLPESESVTRDPYIFRVAPAPSSVKVTQTNLTVSAKPVLSAGERVGVATVSIDGGLPTALVKTTCGYCVTLTRNDFGKSVVFSFNATLAHYADSEAVASDPYVLGVASPPTGISVAQKGLLMTAQITVPTGQFVGAAWVTVGDAAPVSIKPRGGYSTVLLTRSDLGKEVVFSATSTKSGRAASEALSSTPTVFRTANAPVSVTLSQTAKYVSAAIEVPEGQAIGRVTVSVDGGTPTVVRHTSKGYIRTLSKASNGKSVVFYVTSTKSGLLPSEVFTSAPFTFVG